MRRDSMINRFSRIYRYHIFFVYKYRLKMGVWSLTIKFSLFLKMAENSLPNPKPLADDQKRSVPKVPTSIKSKQAKKKSSKRQSAIPKQVANRMARRVALTTGLPTLTGMGVFVGSYVVVSRGIAEIPPSITLITSAGCFLLGLMGLSYGLLSSSWDKAPGTLLGLENIGKNVGRVRSAFSPTKEENIPTEPPTE